MQLQQLILVSQLILTSLQILVQRQRKTIPATCVCRHLNTGLCFPAGISISRAPVAM